MARNFYDNKVITFAFPIPMEKYKYDMGSLFFGIQNKISSDLPCPTAHPTLDILNLGFISIADENYFRILSRQNPQLAIRFINSTATEEVTEGQESHPDFKSQFTELH